MKNENTKKEFREKVKKWAGDKIRVNIYYIYENLKVAEEIKSHREKFCLPPNFFYEYKILNDPAGHEQPTHIFSLLSETLLAWGKLILSDEKIQNQVIENLGKENYESLIANISAPEIKKDSKWNYGVSKLGSYFWTDKHAEIYKPMHINPNIWGSIVMAKVFEIPQDVLIACMDSLLQHYFPVIDKDMRIQINELTSVEDLKYIWPAIEMQQRGYISESHIHNKTKYPNHNRDKTAYELQKNGMENTKIKEELEKLGFGSYDYPYISKIIGAYREFIGEIS